MSHYERVNHFTINLTARKKLGQGSQGTVYPGINELTNDNVAAKRTEGVYKEFFNKEEFEKEADLLLNRIPPHENIIKVYDFTKVEYESKGIPMLDLWLFTEFCEFGNLKEFAFAHDLSTEQTIEIMYQSALAVRHLHGCKPESIAHRDVKPENILVTGSEDNPIIKLCDFGSAKSVTRKGAKSMAMMSLAGTKSYQAPEQFELHDGQFKYDKQVDIFSLGITFLALLNAVKGSLMSPETINEKGLGEIMWRKHKQKQDFTFAVHKPSDSALVRAVKNVIEKMIKFEPSSRLSAAQVVEEISILRTCYSKPQSALKTNIQTTPATAIEPYTQTAPATDTPSAPATDTPSAPATDTPSAPATDTPSAPATDTPSAPATDTPSAPATDTPSGPATDTPSARAPATDTTSVPFRVTPSVTATDTPSATATGSSLAITEAVALYNYEAAKLGELNFRKNDILTITGVVEGEHLYQAKDASGNMGISPANCVQIKGGEGTLLLPEGWTPGTKVVAVCDAKTTCKDTLSFKTFDVLTITGVTYGPNWCQAKDLSGRYGRIPVDHVRRRREVQLLSMPWYHGEITREQAHALLTGDNIPDSMPEKQDPLSNKDVGTFLVQAVTREAAESPAHEYTLHMVSPDKTLEHYCILKQGRKLTIDKTNMFEDLLQLVLFHQKNANGLCARLQIPLLFQGNLSVCVDARDFVNEGWNIKDTEIRILEKCYAGKFTETHRGEYLGEPVFIRMRTDSYSHQGILTEAAIMSGLSHKNVVQLIGVVLGEETLIVTEYLDKGRLFEYLRSQGSDAITRGDQINFARDICQGMQYLEEKGLVHKNLMARSILLSQDGTAKVGYFIFAHHINQNTNVKHFLYRWSAPEVIKQQQLTSIKSDMWSFGVLLWEIYSFGCEPYSGILDKDLLSHVEGGGRQEAPEGCPDAIYHVMSAAWDIDPVKRPTFSDVCRILDRLSEAPPGTTLVALCDYRATCKEELSFKKNDIFTINTVTHDPNWSKTLCKGRTKGIDAFRLFGGRKEAQPQTYAWHYAEDKSGRVGRIPVVHVRRRREVQLLSMPWYHGEITREQAHALLTGDNIPDSMPETQDPLSNKDVGTFLVQAVTREAAESPAHEYTLHMVSPDKTLKHYCILKQGRKLTIDKTNMFEDLLKLVLFHQKNANGLCARLQMPMLFQGDVSVGVDSGAFLSEGWYIDKTEIRILDKCYTGSTDIYKGEYLRRPVFIRRQKRAITEPHHVTNETFLEAAIMTGLSHKNVVQLIGVVLGEDALIVTEYLSKGRLSDYLNSHGPDTMTRHDQLNIARDIRQGMQYLEQKQIVHRKLWAQCILLSDEGTAKVGDFKSARPLGHSHGKMQVLTKWTAPEALLGDSYTSKSDMWSFGILLWEIYSFGETPYPRILKSNVLSFLKQGGRLAAPRGCPEEMYHVMKAAWDIDPTKRPSFSDLSKYKI